MTDVELLINIIQEHSILWDRKNRRYHNRVLSHLEWERVAKLLGSTSIVIKKKWKNLRDTYAKEVKKLSKPQPGADGENQEYIGTWPFFEPMSFMNGSMRPRKKTEAIVEQTSLTDRKRREEVLKSLIETKPPKIRLDKDKVDDDGNDEDLHWFKSVLPYMKMLPPLNRLRFRTQMQELLTTELSKIDFE